MARNVDHKHSDTSTGDTSSAGIGGLRSIFDDPIITSSFLQLGSSEAISGYIPVTADMSFPADGMQPGLVGPSGVAPVRESNDYSHFALSKNDDMTGESRQSTLKVPKFLAHSGHPILLDTGIEYHTLRCVQEATVRGWASTCSNHNSLPWPHPHPHDVSCVRCR
jgi:hypothetical protein